MSNTRTARAGEPLSQERYCSSADFESGLLANLVARRCESLDNPAHVELIFFLQHASHQPGGLKKFTAKLLADYPERLGTRTMQKLGAKPGQVYTAAQAEKIMDESHFALCEERFLDSGSISRPAGPVPARTYIGRCHRAAAGLVDTLTRLCLDPQQLVDKAAPWYFPALLETLADAQQKHATAARAAIAETTTARQVFETLDYALEGRCLAICDGPARTGKSIAAKAWCAMRPGLARYVQTPATNDDLGFWRVIADAMGVSSSLSLKGVQLRERVEQVLQSTKLMLVMDEAHYLWPQNNRREALPNRINWILTALVNYGVPVALLTTPQFTRDQRVVEKKTGWNSAQFVGRIGLYRPLPETLEASDLAAVARCHLPEGREKSIAALVAVAQVSQSYLAGIEHAVNRARHEARKAGRERVTFADVKRAVQLYSIPSDSALNQVLNAAPGHRRAPAPIRATVTAAAPALQTGEPISAPRSTKPAGENAALDRGGSALLHHVT